MTEAQLHISVRGMEQSPALEDHIREKAAKLEQYFSPITTCRVVAEAPHRHQNQGKEFTVRLDIGVPGREIVVTRDHSEDIYVALRDAFAAAGRQLKSYAQSRRPGHNARAVHHRAGLARESGDE